MKNIDLSLAFKDLSPTNKFNHYRELWREASEFKALTSFPLHLDIELSGVCNLKCDSCFQNGLITQPLGLMNFHLFKEIIDEGSKKGLCAIKLQIRGESLLHPRFFDCVDYAKQKGILDIQVTTNGTLLDHLMIRNILDSGLDAVILSVDSHHAQSLFQKKNNYSYSSLEEKINQLLDAREKAGKKKPWIRLQSSISHGDSKSHKAAKSYLKNKFPKADIFVVSRIFDFRCDYDAYPDLHENYELLPCAYLMHRLAIYWDGEVTVCCSDYNNRFNLGSFPAQSIESIWNSKKLQGFRNCHLQGNRKHMDICRHCQASLVLKTTNEDLVLDKTSCHMSDYNEKKR